MGNCWKSCWSCCGGDNWNFTLSKKDLVNLVDEKMHHSNIPSRNILTRIFHKEKKPSRKGIANLLKSELSYHRLFESKKTPPQSFYKKKDIQLQCLDARALLGHSSVSTPENSSLELEWEHETLPATTWTSVYPETVRNDFTTFTDSSSRVSSASANSLEWDSVHHSIHSEGDTLDLDTQFLLSEIDRLTLQALKETGGVSSVEDNNVIYLDDAL